MNVYIYAQSGHNFGLERIRKCAVIAKQLKKYDPVLCTSDYRAASFAKEQLDVIKGAGVDVLTNMPNMMHKGDILIYDSTETTELMQEHMKNYCTLLFEVGNDISTITVDDIYKNQNKSDHNIEKLFYYGDDDYDDFLLNSLSQEDKKFDINCLMGHYMFLGNEDKLTKYFSSVIDEEEYNDTLLDAKYVLTASEQTALEALANNANPVLFKRKDKVYRDDKVLQGCGVPIIEEFNSIEDLISQFEMIITDYPELTRDIFKQFDNDMQQVLEAIAKYDKIIEITNDAMPLYH